MSVGALAGSNLALGLTGLRVLLAAYFCWLAYKGLSGDVAMAADFTRWGYPDWFRLAVAAAQLVGATALLVPNFRLAGVALLGVVLLGAIGTHVLHDPPLTALSPLVVMFLVLVASR